MRTLLRIAMLSAALLSVSCYETAITLRPACGTIAEETELSLVINESTPQNKLDLLLVIDNSPSMIQEQQSLAEQLPRLVRILASGDRNLDGTADFTPISDLHIGVVTPNMGVAGHEGIPSCSDSEGGAMFGDDGVLRTHGDLDIVECAEDYGPYLSFRIDEHTSDLNEAIDELGQKASCLVRNGTDGCAFEQPLEAALKALTPGSNSAITFSDGTFGHGDGANEGFLRDDSVLVILMLTDEDDCSVAAMNGDFFNLSSSEYGGDLGLRCHAYPEALTGVQRYVDGFRALRPGDSQRIIFGAIAGIPVDLVSNAGAIDFEAILNDADMQESIATSGAMAGRGLNPACTSPAGRGEATPARRIVEVAQGLAGYSTVGSICQSDFGSLLDGVIDVIGRATPQTCLDDAHVRENDGRVTCALDVNLPDGESCVAFGGTPTVESIGGVETELCTLSQLAVTTPSGAPVVTAGVGWYYDDFSERIRSACTGASTIQGISLQGITLPSGTATRLRCFERFEGSTTRPPAAGLGAICTGDRASACEGASFSNLFCESSTGTCQLACDLGCPEGLVCDESTAHAVPYCVPPICVSR